MRGHREKVATETECAHTLLGLPSLQTVRSRLALLKPPGLHGILTWQPEQMKTAGIP